MEMTNMAFNLGNCSQNYPKIASPIRFRPR